MFKNRTAVALSIVIVVVLIAAFAGKTWLENRVTKEVHASLEAMGVSAQSVSFALPERVLTLDGIKVKAQPSLGIESASLATVYAELPWNLVLRYKAQGPQLLAEQCSFTGAVVLAEQGRIEIAKGEAINLTHDLGLLIKIMQTAKPEPVDLAAQSEAAAFERAVLSDIMLVAPKDQVSLRVGSISYTDVKGLKVGGIQLDRLEMSMPDTWFADTMEKVSGTPVVALTAGMLRLSGIDVPGNALRLLYELDFVQSSDPDWIQQSFMPTLFGGRHPLFARFEVKDLLIPVFYNASVQEYTIDWTSVSPMRYASRLTQARLPLEKLLENTEFSLPKLDALTLNNTVVVAAQPDGVISEHITFAMPELGDLELRLLMSVAPESAGGASNLWNYDPFNENINLRSIDVSFTDKNLLAYLLYNLDSATPSVDNLLDALPSGTETDEAAYTQMIDAVGAFIRHPGSLSLHYAPPEPTPLTALWSVVIDPSQLSFTAVPGPRSLQDVIQSLYGSHKK